MKEIKKKLYKINKIFIYQIWETESLKKIVSPRDNGKVWRNYFSSIYNYFNDTLEILDKKWNFNGKNIDTLTEIIGTMQIIYVHQDLIDEMLGMFILDRSLREDKNSNRIIRNKLIGHPINWKDKSNKEKVKTMVTCSDFDGSQDSLIKNKNYYKGSMFQYRTYELNGDSPYSKLKIEEYDMNQIISTHKNFLNKYLDIIINKINDKLKEYIKKLEEELIILEKENNDKENLIKVIDFTLGFLTVMKDTKVYTKEYLLKCYEKINEHERYKFIVSEYFKNVKENLIDNLNKYKEMNNSKELNSSLSDNNMGFENNQFYDSIRKDLADIHEKKYKDSIKNLKSAIISNKSDSSEKIINELENMENDYYNNFEYYVSYEYLGHLINEDYPKESIEIKPTIIIDFE